MQQRSKARRVRRSGMTLIEVMIVVVIMAMIAAAAGFAVKHAKDEADRNLARSDVKALAQIAEAYQITHTNECPTLAELEQSRLLRRGSNTQDPWGHAYEIVCDTGDVNVRSSGPDGEPGNGDDIAAFK
jgi:general secretion pathway protein G